MTRWVLIETSFPALRLLAGWPGPRAEVNPEWRHIPEWALEPGWPHRHTSWSLFIVRIGVLLGFWRSDPARGNGPSARASG